MRQVFCVKKAGPFSGSGTSDRYASPTGLHFSSAVEATGTQPWGVAGNFLNLRVARSASPGSGNSTTYTLRVNGVDSGLSVVISDPNTFGSDTHSVAVSPGDRISLHYNRSWGASPPNDTADHDIQLEFEGSTLGESGYGFARSLIDVSHRYNGIYWAGADGGGDWQSVGIIFGVNAVSGALTRYDIDLSAAPGAGVTWTFSLVVNGVTQDGSGGTTDTRLSITGGSTSGTWTGSLHISPGDQIYIQQSLSGTPPTTFAAASFKFVADVDGQSNVSWNQLNPIVNTTDTFYTAPAGHVGWNLTEASAALQAATLSGYSLSGLQIFCHTNPGGGRSRVFTLRRNQLAVGGAPSVTITGSAKTGSDVVGSLSYSASDTWDLKMDQIGNPFGSTDYVSFGFIQTAVGVVIPTGPTGCPQDLPIPSGSSTSGCTASI